MSSRFNCFRDTSVSPVVVGTDGGGSATSRCPPQRQVPVEAGAERRCSLQDPAVQRCVAAELAPSGIASRRLAAAAGPAQSRRRCCSLVQCGTAAAAAAAAAAGQDAAPPGVWTQFSPGAAGRKELAAASVSSPGVSPSSSSRSIHYLLQSPVRRYEFIVLFQPRQHVREDG